MRLEFAVPHSFCTVAARRLTLAIPRSLLRGHLIEGRVRETVGFSDENSSLIPRQLAAECSLKSINWKTLLIGTCATFILVLLLLTVSSLTADIVLLKIYNNDYTFSLFSKEDGGFFVFSLNPKQNDAGYAASFEHFYKDWFPFISVIVSTLGCLLGSLSWPAPIGIAGSYGGALLARRKS